VTENSAVPQPSLAARRVHRERLRRAAGQLARATVLERRAGRSPSTALAGLLRECAARHRRMAARVGAGLLTGTDESR
jgi:hypothetical protein